MAKAILLVGHSNWGKSLTLRALTGNGRQTMDIGNCTVFIRRMSNDDKPEDLVRLVNGLNVNLRPYVIIAFCPNREDVEILDVLRHNYQLYFWVLKYDYTGNREITDEEIMWMGQFGTVEVFDRIAESRERAEYLRNFLNNILP